MYLKRIIAHGFKSFADKLNIEFESGISGIVGPNGSGKSNIVDAVRWVLGEQSIKSLRGGSVMTDVIFSGSNSRHASNQASITLVFDNTDHYLPIDYNEVSIKRQVYKDGTQEYYLNGEKCRLKDITNILLDTGIAKESFNIISQGKVDEIITSKPSERRVIFEEAAGVLKYKKRKEDALRKLERTHDNMERVDDIIEELKVQVEPLLEQREKAVIYKEKTNKLKEIEIALIAHDITQINNTYKREKEQIKALNEEILKLTSTNTNSEAVMEKYKLSISKLNEELNNLSKQLLDKTSEVERINGQKQIILERKKYQVEDAKLHNSLVSLKEEELNLANQLSSIKRELESIKKDIEDKNYGITKVQNEFINVKNNRVIIENNLNNALKENVVLQNKINALREAIDNNSTLPYSVKQVLNNPRLTGIHNAIGNLIEVSEEYSKAISISLSMNNSSIVTETENDAKEAIKYLKENNLGRATFYPIDKIKGKYLDHETYEKIKHISGFIDVASNLVKYNPIYKDIINYHLGSVIVASDINSATNIGRILLNRRKVVSLDGDVINIGGSLTGGSLKNIRNIIQDKYELENSLKKQNINIENQKKIEENLNDYDSKLKDLEDRVYLLTKEKNLKNDLYAAKEKQQFQISEKLMNIRNEISRTNHILNGSISEEEERILNLYYKEVDEKNKLESLINTKTNERDLKQVELDDYEFSLRRENSKVNSKNKELKALEIEVNRKDVKLDNYLNILSETYNLTYERAKEKYVLSVDEQEARKSVAKLKREINDLGMVNLGAIEEYDRVSTRYEFLNKQKEDLEKAEDTLLEIINEMDDVMKKEFKTSFDIINKHFSETFKELFGGGYGELKLTDPSNMLETGIEIVASPPGKKLTSISLLSGGEKTFTAISVLFAILKSRPVPFCILDEVEAALDEANVNSFGNYLTKMKDKTQFILITHKKKTMEYADILYGITMQESGVSKLVSVKLEDL